MNNEPINNENQNISEPQSVINNQNINTDMSNNQIQNNTPPKKKSNKTIIICLIVLLLIVGATITIFFLNNKKEEPNVNEPSSNETDEKDQEGDDQEIEEEPEEIEEDETDEYYGYKVEKVGNDYVLTRNSKEVAKLNKQDKFKLYKDANDANSRYIAVGYTNDEFTLGTSIKNSGYAYLNVLVDEEKFTWNSILYNVKTGKSQTFDNVLTTVIFGKYDNDNLSKDYVALIQDNDDATGYNLIDLKTFNVINKNNYLVIGDGILMSMDNSLWSHNNKFIIIVDKKSSKYGLMDLTGKVLVDLKYNQMQTFENENVIIAEENGKFGAIDSTGKVLINFDYDGIDYENGYFAVSKNNKLGVLDKTGKEVAPLSVDLPNCTSFKFRRDYEANAFIIETVDNNELVVAYLDKKTMKKTSSYNVCNNNYTYKYDYLVVTRDGQYKTYDTYKDYDESTWYK